MLIGFFKPDGLTNCLCEVTTFCDRIWLWKDKTLTCNRTFLISVSEDSPSSLNQLNIVMPHRELINYEDKSYTFFERDNKHNTRRTQGFEILKQTPEESYGEILFDGFKCTVSTKNKIDFLLLPSQNPSCYYCNINFAEEINPGEHRAFRFEFTLTSNNFLIQHGSWLHTIKLYYFEDSCVKPYKELHNMHETEIPVKSIYDSERLQGGFDIFLYTPEHDYNSSFNVDKWVSNFLPDNQNSDQTFPKYIWRARIIHSDKDYLQMGKTVIPVEGFLHDPEENKQITKKIETLEKTSDDTSKKILGIRRSSIWALILAIGSFIGTIISLIAIFSSA